MKQSSLTRTHAILIATGIAILTLTFFLAGGFYSGEGREGMTKMSSDSSFIAQHAQAENSKPAVTREPVTVEGTKGAASFTYRVPAQGEPDFADYQEMLAHPEYARFNTSSDAPPYYDPEWRAKIEGKRTVEVHDLRLTSTTSSLDELARFFLMALAERDGQALDQIRVTRDEFQLICWPEFPQSRPYLRIPPDEGWTFHMASMQRGAKKALTEYGGRNFSLTSLRVGSEERFTNFDLLTGIELVVQDEDSGESLVLDAFETVIRCRGEYKGYMYKE